MFIEVIQSFSPSDKNAHEMLKGIFDGCNWLKKTTSYMDRLVESCILPEILVHLFVHVERDFYENMEKFLTVSESLFFNC